jgi:hypothetical protein
MYVRKSLYLLPAFTFAVALSVYVVSCKEATAPVGGNLTQPASPSKYAPGFNDDNFWVPQYTIEPKLPLALTKHDPLPPETVAKIKQSIANLSEIDSPDFGFSPTLTGSAFLPLPEQTHSDALLLTDHRLKASAELKALVEWGPYALPYLLAALDDKTPTKLVIQHGSGMGGMFFGNELDWNPMNDQEKDIFAKYTRQEWDRKPSLSSYTVHVGDVCFVAIGEIVGRRYRAVRYQPTAIVVINSTVEDPELCRLVRQVWTGPDPRQKLLDSLLTDYATRAAFNGNSLDGWDVGSDMQIASAMRLLYYFPKESSGAIAERLQQLKVKNIGQIDAFIAQEVANGVRAKEFIEATQMCPEPPIRQAIRGIFDRTDDYQIVLATLPAMDDKTVIKQRLSALLAVAPAEEHGAYGEGYRLLVAAYKTLGDDAAPMFERFTDHGSAQRAYSTAEALSSIKTKWSDAILLRLLDDKRPFPTYAHGVASPNDEHSLVIRVCDQAAEALQAHHAELKFEMVGTTEQMDAQVQAIRTEMAKR